MNSTVIQPPLRAGTRRSSVGATVIIASSGALVDQTLMVAGIAPHRGGRRLSIKGRIPKNHFSGVARVLSAQ
jgi:hypothetical protein